MLCTTHTALVDHQHKYAAKIVTFLHIWYLCPMKFTDTIVSISTPAGVGAIALIRLSGPDSIQIVINQMLIQPWKAGINQPADRHAYYCQLVEGEELIDEVLVTFFRSPHSYSGEDMAEITCHGSIYIQDRLLQLFITAGARLAERGEFTFRAFINGRIDLAQAEGVADLIASVNPSQHRLAMDQMRGGISSKLKELRERLVEFAALLELELDFSQEDVTFADRGDLQDLLVSLTNTVEQLRGSFTIGNAMKRGIPVTIAGRPNAGKSTLLNALLNEEKAIVSEIPGTTRDTIEDTVLIGNTPFRFIDTAGLRSEAESLEAIGIERTYEKIAQAAVVLYLFDASETGIEALKEELAGLFKDLSERVDRSVLDEKQFIMVANKIDQLVEIPAHFVDYLEMEVVFISAKRHENLQELTDSLLKSASRFQLQEQLVITNARHFESLTHSSEALHDAKEALEQGVPADLVAVDIRKALYHIGVITGEVTNNEMLGNIFGRFCIGK
jgi:tRNA modification GTPase